MYIVNFGCVLLFMMGILKNFDFFENFLKIFQSHFSTQFLAVYIALFCAYFDNMIIST